MLYLVNRAFLHDIAFTILVSQNNKTAATLVSQTSPVRVQSLGRSLFRAAKAFRVTWSRNHENLLKSILRKRLLP